MSHVRNKCQYLDASSKSPNISLQISKDLLTDVTQSFIMLEMSMYLVTYKISTACCLLYIINQKDQQFTKKSFITFSLCIDLE